MNEKDIAAVQRLREERHAKIQAWRAVLDKADAEARDLTAEELQEADTRYSEIQGLDKQISTRELAINMDATLKVGDEQRLAPRNTGVEKPLADTEEYRTAFNQYLRTGVMEHRDALLSPNTAGGYTVPRGFLNTLVEYRSQYGVVRSLADVFTTDSGNTLDLPTLTGRGAASFTAEAAAYSETDETFGAVTFGAHKMTRIVQVSEELLQDSAFDLAGLLARRFGQALAIRENTAFISGTGSGEPLGMATASGLTTGQTTSGATAITFDEVLDLLHSVGPQYRQNAAWIMSDSILAYLRKIKTGVASDLRYIWQESATSGSPSLLFGFPWYVDPDMAATSSGNPVTATRTMLFGDFRQAYSIRDAGGVRIRRMDERYADTGQVGFSVSARIDGQVVDNTAAKCLLQA